MICAIGGDAGSGAGSGAAAGAGESEVMPKISISGSVSQEIIVAKWENTVASSVHGTYKRTYLYKTELYTCVYLYKLGMENV